MGQGELRFDHIHIISDDPRASAEWYQRVLHGKITGENEVRKAPQIGVEFGSMRILIRGKRQGEEPTSPADMTHHDDYSSHGEWGTDHFGFTYHGDLYAYCEELRKQGVTFSVEPYEFVPGVVICYLNAPDGVSIELVQSKRP